MYELYIRQYYLFPPKRSHAYHHQVVAQVRAEQQASHLQALFPHLTSTELDLVKRGRNATTGKPKRIDLATYQQATALETLIGYLYLTDPERLTELLNRLVLAPSPKPSKGDLTEPLLSQPPVCETGSVVLPPGN